LERPRSAEPASNFLPVKVGIAMPRPALARADEVIE
jgi:hypothetical protein